MQGGGRHRGVACAPARVGQCPRTVPWRGCAPVAQRRDERESGWNPGISLRAARIHTVAGAAGTRAARMADMRPRLALKAVRSARLAAVDLALAPGECAAVMGPSGSGKSLLLRQVADLDPGEGEVELDGAPRSGMAGYEWRRQVIYCQAEAGWWEERVAAHLTTLPPPSGWWSGWGWRPKNAGAGARAVHRRTPAFGPGARLGETAARAAAGTNPRRPWIRTPPRVSRPRSAAIWTKAARRCW